MTSAVETSHVPTLPPGSAGLGTCSGGWANPASITWLIVIALSVTVSVWVYWLIVCELTPSGDAPLLAPAVQAAPSNVSRFSAFQYSPLNTWGEACTSRTALPVRGQTSGP